MKNFSHQRTQRISRRHVNGIITLPLSQEDTLLFSELEPVWVQLRLRDNLDNAIASEPMRVNVGEIFKDGVI